jgi:hypothetical protein
MSDKYKLYIYCSKHPDDINTIDKVAAIHPTIIIDESIATPQDVNGKQCYIVYDTANAPEQDGIEYYGPIPNLVPTSEYETLITVVPVNNYTFVNQLEIEALPIKFNGTMLYYSIIGVDTENNTITHLSKVSGVLIKSDYQTEGTRHLYSCDKYTGKDTDVWKYVTSVAWDKQIKIGDINDPATMARFGIPMVETVNIFSGDEVSVKSKSVALRNFMVLEIPNVWQNNNKQYNYREMKSYKLQNVCDEQYSDFSEPTYQSLLPVSIEKMLILKETGPADPSKPISIEDSSRESIDIYQVIRKDGNYYDASKHRKLGLNKYNIPVEEPIAVFSESSVQDLIKMQVPGLPNHIYSFSIYLIDVYGNMSAPAHFIART